MKNSNYLFFTLLFLSILSCTENDSVNTSINENDILGSWNISNYNAYSQEATAYVNGQSISGDFYSYGSNMSITSHFQKNPNLVTTQGYFITNNSFNFLGQSYNYNYDVNQIPDFISTLNWELQDNVISFSNEEQTILADIVYFRNDTLLLKSLFNKKIDSMNMNINQQIDSLNFTTLPIDSLSIKSELYLTLTR